MASPDLIENEKRLVISGISGVFPKTANTEELFHHLMNKIDLLTNIKDSERFAPEMFSPERLGLFDTIYLFDNRFFSIKDSEMMRVDPVLSQSLVKIFEAFMDAGLSLEEIKGSRTGIYVGAAYAEYENYLYEGQHRHNFLQVAKTGFTAVIGSFFELNGPLMFCDTACSSSFSALHSAYLDLRMGRVDRAIVLGANLILNPNVSIQFNTLGVISSTGYCRPFDWKGDGYVRSETAACVIIEKASTAKRQYLELIHCDCNSDGYKEMGITFPAWGGQLQLLNRFYKEVPIPMDQIGYVEAHATGTKAGDPAELEAILRKFCQNRKDRLLVGSIKSNLGHSEPSSGLSSIIKCCLNAQSGLLLPNMNYEKPRKGIAHLLNGPMKVVTEAVPINKEQPYFAVDNFGFGGANSHLLLKIGNDSDLTPLKTSAATLVCVAGRTEAAVKALLEGVAKNQSREFVFLIHSLFKNNTKMYYTRGYGIFMGRKIIHSQIYSCYTMNKSLICIFGNKINNCDQLYNMELFKKHIKECDKILHSNGFNLNDLLKKKNGSLENVFKIIISQTGLVKVFEALNIKFDHSDGYGIGVLTAAYQNKSITLTQTILAAAFITMLNAKEMFNNSKVGASLKSILNNNNISGLLEQLNRSTDNDLKIQKNHNYLYVGQSQATKSNLVNFLNGGDLWVSLGEVYLLGYCLSLENIYEKVKTPVSAKTPSISPLIKWHMHTSTWTNKNGSLGKIPVAQHSISLDHPQWAFISGHNIDGRVLFPATGYIFLLWQCFSKGHFKPIVLENIKFLRACTLSNISNLELSVYLSKSGNFEILDKDSIVVTGELKLEEFDLKKHWIHLDPLPEPKPEQVMNKKDIYKELNLRGYRYQKNFKELTDCDINATVGHVKWTNWISFMDCMLQMKILQMDTRSLYVPVKIGKITISAYDHTNLMPFYIPYHQTELPVYNYKELDIIRCGYIEIRGLRVSGLARRKHPTPVLEMNKFIPYSCNLEVNEAVRVISQICLENNYSVNIKVTEIFLDPPTNCDPLIPMIQDSLKDQPLIQHELILYSEDSNLKLPGVTINSIFGNDINCYISIGFNLLDNTTLKSRLIKGLKPGCFLISRESKASQLNYPNDLSVLSEYHTSNEILLLMRPLLEEVKENLAQVDISKEGFNWLKPIQEARKNKSNILLYSQNELNNGLLGLTNCLLRESGQEHISAYLINDEKAVKFNLNQDIYRKQYAKHLAVNVFRDGVWGSYRHLRLNQAKLMPSNHSVASYKAKGDFGSLFWGQGSLNNSNNIKQAVAEGNVIIQVYASAINFKDIMLASGKLAIENITTVRREQEITIGFEAAGRLEKFGQRVMYISKPGGMSNVHRVSSTSIIEIPENISMEDACTMPCVYLTNILGMLQRGELKKGESILIHSATGGIGMSAINIAQFYKCIIFVTVGTEEKRKFILENYPNIPESHIGNSRDTSFYNMILKETKGKGVDMVLNSLADEKLQMSVKCLARGGRMIEIGKYDLANDSWLQLELCQRNAQYHGVMLDLLIESKSESLDGLIEMFKEGLKQGFIKPLPKKIFQHNEIEEAFRYMSTGKHIGKVILKIRDEESQTKIVPKLFNIPAEPRFQCDSKGVYIIAGGLGGCGLEIADWLSLKGAHTIVLISRTGVTTGYQRYRIQIWEGYGVNIVISTHDITKKEGCKEMLTMASKHGSIVGIFNLAVVLKDAIIENQTLETFQESYNAKAQSTINLDELTRTMCPELKYFVVFSSVSCGRGNAGQTNYGYSNSVMERICEKRRVDGYPGVAIQWGVIGDVGIVADLKEQNIEIVIGGTLQQRISNCLEVMNVLLVSDEPIVSSMIVAEKKIADKELTIVDVIAQALEIKDVKTLGLNLTLPEIGMDSIVSVEIKQTLEREFDIFLSPQELRTMTLARLLELSRGPDTVTTEVSKINKTNDLLEKQFPKLGEYIKPLKRLTTLGSNENTKIFFVPGLECASDKMETLAKQLKSEAKCIQYNGTNLKKSITEYSEDLSEHIEREFSKDKPFIIAAYSLGTTTSLETVAALERKGYRGTLIILDGSPLMSKSIILEENLETANSEDLDFYLLFKIMRSALPVSKTEFEKISEQLKKVDESDRLRTAIKLSNCSFENYPEEHIFNYLSAFYNRMKAEVRHQIKDKHLKSRIILCKATTTLYKNIPSDYGLSDFLANQVEVREFEGDHETILENLKLASFIQEIIDSYK